MPPNFPQFRPLEIEDQAFIDKFFDELFPPYSDHTFSNLWTWNSQNQTQVSRLNNNLVIRLNDYVTNEPFLTFLGNKNIAETIEVLLSQGLVPEPREGSNPIRTLLKLVPHHCLVNDSIDGPRADLLSRYQIDEDRDNFDYVYNLSDLAELKGNRYRGKRNFVNRFNKLYRWQTRPLDIREDETWRQMQTLYRLWSGRQTQKENDVENESKALSRLREISSRINLFCLGLFVEEKLVGYTINEIKQNYQGEIIFATNLFEHADLNFVGVFSLLMQQTAVELLKLDHKYLSHQQDLGLPGLRKSKQDLHPTFFLKKYSIRIRDLTN